MTAETTNPASFSNARPLQPRRGRVPLFLAILAFTAGGVYVGMRWHTTFERWLVPSAGSGATSSPDRADTGAGAPKKQL